MNDEEFVMIQNILLDNLISNSIKRLCLDLREFNFAVRPYIQEKIARENYPKAIQAGLRRVAIINSKELISQLSAEQMMEEDESGLFITKYFDNKSEAMDWVLPKK